MQWLLIVSQFTETHSIENKSTIIVCGSSGQVTDSTNNPDKGKKIYGIEIGDKAVVDGILVALGSPGDIKTHPDVKITGIMIAQKSVGHLGKMAGLICAAQFVDPDARKLNLTTTRNAVKKRDSWRP